MEKRICEGVADKFLDAKVSDYHIAEIASDLKEWEVLAPNFSLTEIEQKETLKVDTISKSVKLYMFGDGRMVIRLLTEISLVFVVLKV